MGAVIDPGVASYFHLGDAFLDARKRQCSVFNTRILTHHGYNPDRHACDACSEKQACSKQSIRPMSIRPPSEELGMMLGEAMLILPLFSHCSIACSL